MENIWRNDDVAVGRHDNTDEITPGTMISMW